MIIPEQSYILHEFSERKEFYNSPEKLEIILQKIWDSREKQIYFKDRDKDNKDDVQQLLSVIRKTNVTEIKAKNYVGIIKYQDKGIETTVSVYPKIFKNYKGIDKPFLVQKNIIYWLSYCTKLRLPNYKSSLDSYKGDFLELLIYYFAKYTKDLFSKSLYQNYIDIEAELSTVRGKINMPAYFTNNLSNGRWHKVACRYQVHSLDNRFNRIVKAIAKLLILKTKVDSNKKILKDIIFILDDVKDISPTRRDCERVRFNKMFSDFDTVLAYCKLFLSSSISYHKNSRDNLFAFLIDMNVLFEDFIAGFIKKEIPEFKYKTQSSKIFLTQNNDYQLKPDLINKSHIIDTKYKIINEDYKVQQSDLYQMISYAIRHRIKNLTLLYPKIYDEDYNINNDYVVKDEFNKEISITIMVRHIDIVINSNEDKERIKVDLAQLITHASS